MQVAGHEKEYGRWVDHMLPRWDSSSPLKEKTSLGNEQKNKNKAQVNGTKNCVEWTGGNKRKTAKHILNMKWIYTQRGDIWYTYALLLTGTSLYAFFAFCALFVVVFIF